MTSEFVTGFPDAKKHARKMFPEESCGFIVDGVYIPVENKADDPSKHEDGNSDCGCRLCHFKISKLDTGKYLSQAQMIIHSHPNGPIFPSKADMQGQMATCVPWGIITLDETRIGDPEIWGDELPLTPLLNRSFLHGVRDCYSLIRDAYRLGRQGMIEEGITNHWPLDSIILEDAARSDAWWDNKEDDLYQNLAGPFGWKEVPLVDAKPGDVFLMKLKSEKFNHGGLLISDDLIMHHLPNRFSRREPSGAWARSAGKWLRYTGEKYNA